MKTFKQYLGENIAGKKQKELFNHAFKELNFVRQ